MSDGLLFKCPGCDADFEADLEMIGTEAECPECGIHFIVPMPVAQAGLEIAGFRLQKRLGEGGMGEVWLAEQVAMGRQVAVKLLSPSLVSKPDFVKRFMHEVRMAGRLEHPNIITAFDAGQVQGFFYLAMAYCDGVELSDRMRIDQRIPEKEALKIARDIASALDYAWNEHKILHRDIKPSNIMVDGRGNARLMDMGISKSFKDAPELTMSGTIVGTPYYISPEQGRADTNVDFRADIYSLGATLYHMVVGQLPYDGENTLEIVSKHIHQPLPPPRQINPALSAPVCALIEKMMSKDPNGRQGSWQNVIADIDNVMNGKMPDSSTVHNPKADPHGVFNANRTMAMDAVKVSPPSDIKIKINTRGGDTSASAPASAGAPASSPASSPLTIPGKKTDATVIAPPAAKSDIKIKGKTAAPPPGKAVEPPPFQRSPMSSDRRIAMILWTAAVLILLVGGLRIMLSSSRVDKLRAVSLDGNKLKNVNALMAKLQSDAAVLVGQNKREEGINLLLEYNGEMAAETLSARQRLADTLRRQGEAPEAPKKVIAPAVPAKR